MAYNTTLYDGSDIENGTLEVVVHIEVNKTHVMVVYLILDSRLSAFAPLKKYHAICCALQDEK